MVSSIILKHILSPFAIPFIQNVELHNQVLTYAFIHCILSSPTAVSRDWCNFYPICQPLVYHKGELVIRNNLTVDTKRISKTNQVLLASAVVDAAIQFYRVKEHQEQFQQWHTEQEGGKYNEKERHRNAEK